MGYGGKVRERNRARQLRAESWTLQDIADELGVAKSSVSLWVRDVEFVPNPRRRTYWTRDNPHPLQIAKEREIDRCREEGVERIGQLSEREFLVLGLALYAGEGGKTGSKLTFANSDPRLIMAWLTWMRTFLAIDESRLRMHLYLHEHLDLDAANAFWSDVTGIPVTQFQAPYRAVVDRTIRRSKHVMGCPSVVYACAHSFRRVMGVIAALTSPTAIPG